MKKLNRLTLPLTLLLISQSAGRAIAQSAEGFDGDIYSTDIGSPTETQIDGDGCEWQATWDPLPDPLIEKYGPGMQEDTIFGYFGTDVTGWTGTGGSAFAQVFAAFKAKDNVTGLSSDGAYTFWGDQHVHLFRVDNNPCGSEIKGTLKPKFRIRAAVVNDASLSEESVDIDVHVTLTVPQLDIQSDLQGRIKQTDSGGSAQGSVSYGGVRFPVFVPSLGSTQSESGFMGIPQHETRELAEVDLYTAQNANISFLADGWTQWPLQDDSELEGFVYDSFAGAELRGSCLPRFGPGPGGGGGTPVLDGTESAGTCSCTEGLIVQCSFY
ncbi:MAG TPA: hypothetical protein EYQ25_11975 [Planctomycetes bacterium]|nr:hypothetical protein [Planctomycetota bacterium]